MKKILLNPEKSYYKANLHCHSTISDGSKSITELKEMYKREGYSVIAYTDHNVLLDHSDLRDENFLPLNGMELDVSDDTGGWFPHTKACHLCYIALEPDNLMQPCYHRTDYMFGNSGNYRNLLKFDDSKPDFVRKYSPECINEMIAQGRENGFFVTYNHPAWSLENLYDYGKYTGMNAMEICNYGCFEVGFTDYNENAYDDILRTGKKIFCIAADDNHNRRNDSFGGFTVINADKLEYRTITNALERGNFYASQGPQIYELYVEDGKIAVKCSNAASIRLNTGVRHTEIVYAESETQPVNSAVFDIRESDVYVRITVTDFKGKHANTNAYFIEDLKI